MTVRLKIMIIILANFTSIVGEECFRTCVYDMLELKEKIKQLENALNKIEELENKVEKLNVELQVQKNKTKGNN